ncbi:MAG: hypothetical protein ABSH15_00575 [Verrucomicrobiota bacterium]|jgi:hypothetical protein
MNPQDITLCLRPRKLKVSDVRKLLEQKDDTAKEYLADLILHRLRDRYVTPLEHVPIKPTDFRSGFLMMAASCLMIEAFQCFKEGRRDTKGKGKGKAAFKKFFSDYSSEFSRIDGEEFYEKIRCGILHQAQTHGRYRILRGGAIFDSAEKSINATAFLKTLKTIVEDYVSDLRVQDMNADPWTNALRKIEYICETIENE